MKRTMGRPESSMWLSTPLGSFLREAMQRNFGRCSPSDTWAPPVNVYQLRDRLELCVDLAGVDRANLDVRVEPGRLVIRGLRRTPEPAHGENQPMRILTMEIDYGPFQREITLPSEVQLDRVSSSYEDGLLWIALPLRETE